MRTKVALDHDVERQVQQRMRRRNIAFDQALNELVRVGHASLSRASEFQTSTDSMGQPGLNLDKALQFAGEFEDDELVGATQMQQCS